jgi:hypothetical protein
MKATCLEPVTFLRSSTAAAEPLAVLAARAADALERSLQHLVLASEQTLGHLEVQAAHDVQELLRQAIQRGAQAKATEVLCVVNFIFQLSVNSFS